MWFAEEPTMLAVPVLESADDSTGVGVLFAGVWLFVWLVVAVVAIVAMWKIFTKAGEAGWKSIIPIYNIYI